MALPPQTCQFGADPAQSLALIAAIRAGRKTATCSALRDWQGQALPKAGQVMQVLHHDDRPALRYRLQTVETRRFDQVTEAFARAEGAACLADWQAEHMAFFTATGGFDPAMMLLCETFAPFPEAKA